MRRKALGTRNESKCIFRSVSDLASERLVGPVDVAYGSKGNLESLLREQEKCHLLLRRPCREGCHISMLNGFQSIDFVGRLRCWEVGERRAAWWWVWGRGKVVAPLDRVLSLAF